MVSILSAIAALLLQACGKAYGDYFPLGDNGRWHYAITVTTTKGTNTGRMIVASLPDRDWNGRRIYVNHLNDGTLYLYSEDKDGIRRVGVKRAMNQAVIADPENHLVLPFPIEAGKIWVQTTTTGVLETIVTASGHPFSLNLPVELTYRIESTNDEVQVPAGVFTGCARVHGVGITRYQGDNLILTSYVTVDHIDWYAPGVGLIKSQRVETTTSGVIPRGDYLLELQSYERS